MQRRRRSVFVLSESRFGEGQQMSTRNPSTISTISTTTVNTRTVRLRVLVIACCLLAVLATTTQCKSKYAKYCENQKTCEGGNDKDLDACIESRRTKEEVAEAYDCENSFDEVTKCYD